MSSVIAALLLSQHLQSPHPGCQRNWWRLQLHLTLEALVPDLQTSGALSWLSRTSCSDTWSAEKSNTILLKMRTRRNSYNRHRPIVEYIILPKKPTDFTQTDICNFIILALDNDEVWSNFPLEKKQLMVAS